MEQKRINYQKKLDAYLESLEERHERPKLLLHSCCAPCSSYVLEYLSRWFDLSVFYYNPNIEPEEEYLKRAGELERLIREMPLTGEVQFFTGPYEPERFHSMARGLENEPEGGKRCAGCFELRLRASAREAVRRGIGLFTTTLTISPLKNADVLNDIGKRIAEEEGIEFLPSDFKKKNGYKRSVELSEQYGLYRQNFCGCVYSKRRQ